METKKIEKISSYLHREGFSKVASKLKSKKFGEPFTLTQYINKNCKLKTNQWDKILSIVNNE